MMKFIVAFGLAAALPTALAFSAVAPAAVADAGKANFAKYKSALPADLNVVEAGGWYAMQKLAADPKGELVKLVKDQLKASGGRTETDESGKVDALIALLYSRGKGFESDLVDGEWTSVLSRQGKNSPRIQKVVEKTETDKTAENIFDTKTLTFSGITYTPHHRGMLKSFVSYNPTSEGFDKSINGNIVVRRIMCDITGASFKYWKFPTLPLPLKKKGGYLDFVFMDQDIRVTRGNRGGLFVHFRPAFLEKVLKE